MPTGGRPRNTRRACPATEAAAQADGSRHGRPPPGCAPHGPRGGVSRTARCRAGHDGDRSTAGRLTGHRANPRPSRSHEARRQLAPASRVPCAALRSGTACVGCGRCGHARRRATAQDGSALRTTDGALRRQVVPADHSILPGGRAPVAAVPEHLPTVTPGLVVRNAVRAVDFYRDAFAAVEVAERFTGPAGQLIHTEL